MTVAEHIETINALEARTAEYGYGSTNTKEHDNYLLEKFKSFTNDEIARLNNIVTTYCILYNNEFANNLHAELTRVIVLREN